ncbi:hypothetical protein [Fenollaria timonensis]|uniref:hypothetical protein n=1 Tax=Fenollaria timonensis TaxID=1723384 RepID=UPI00071DEC14|nr:hypothetical protein [Fenollaria timonensis]
MKRKTKLINIYLLKTYKFVLGLVEGDFSLQVCTERIALSTQKVSKGASKRKIKKEKAIVSKTTIANAKDIILIFANKIILIQ